MAFDNGDLEGADIEKKKGKARGKPISPAKLAAGEPPANLGKTTRKIGKNHPLILQDDNPQYNHQKNHQYTNAREGRSKPDLPSKNFCRAVQARWNAMASLHAGLPTLDLFTPQRLNYLRFRLQDCQGDESKIMKAIDNVPNDLHRLGNTQGGWRADFDWVFGESKNFLKCLESKPLPKETHERDSQNRSKSPATIGELRRQRRGALLNQLETELPEYRDDG